MVGGWKFGVKVGGLNCCDEGGGGPFCGFLTSPLGVVLGTLGGGSNSESTDVETPGMTVGALLVVGCCAASEYFDEFSLKTR